MSIKSEQLQIRVTPAQKALLRRRARESGQDVSEYVLTRVLPDADARFQALVRALESAADYRFPLAEMNDLLAGLRGARLQAAVAAVPAEYGGLSAKLRNYVAAMVEQACGQHGITPPSWVRGVEPLIAPYFAGGLSSLRLYLLRVSPVAFKRRNIFIDTAVGGRI